MKRGALVESSGTTPTCVCRKAIAVAHRQLVLLVCCGSDAIFGKVSQLPSCLQGMDSLQISLGIPDALRSK